MGGLEIIAVLGAYVVGCFCTGYYLVLWQKGMDIRDHGSGSVGARNVGRLLGARGFVVTVVGDVGKGVLTVVVARHLALEPPATACAMIAVVMGHIWPAQLRFRGGKGVSTSLGALLVFDYRLLVTLLVILGVTAVLTRRFTLSGLFAFAILPPAAMVFDCGRVVAAGLGVLALLVIVAHRSNIVKMIRTARPTKAAGETRPTAARGIPE